MRHIIPISGKDSLWTAIYQKSISPNLNYEYVFSDTGSELPETYEWLDKVEKFLEKPVARVGDSLEGIIDEFQILPSQHRRFCTKYSKIFPINKFIGKEKAFLYLGIRADENRTLNVDGVSKTITSVYPLISGNQRFTDVWEGLSKINMLPPAFEYTKVVELVKSLLKEKANLIDNLHPLTRRYLFAGRSRTNCYFCFFQRRYEWMWLSDYYPEHFERACQLEEQYGSSAFTWIRDNPLRDLVKTKDIIVYERARVIYKLILQNEINLLKNEEAPIDLLNVVSCGLFCGK